jgi:DUF4097 and DUF4098 domain-containing protein YvlB
MRSGWRFSLLAVLLALPGSARSERAPTADDRWCEEDDGWNDEARHCEVRESALPAGAAIDVDARPNGGVEVRGWDRNEVRLRAKVTASGRTQAEAKALAGQVRIETGETIHVVGPDRRERGRGWWVSFRLDVPRSARLNLVADNGGLSLRDVSGEAELRTVNGGLHLDRVGGKVHGRTVNGGVHVTLSGTEWDGEGLDLRTTNGGLHIEAPADYNARLEAGTVNGGVHSEIPLTSRGRWNGGRIETDLGHGGSLIRLETTNGGLHLNRR